MWKERKFEKLLLVEKLLSRIKLKFRIQFSRFYWLHYGHVWTSFELEIDLVKISCKIFFWVHNSLLALFFYLLFMTINQCLSSVDNMLRKYKPKRRHALTVEYLAEYPNWLFYDINRSFGQWYMLYITLC